MPEQTPPPVEPVAEREPSEEILRPNYNPENLPNSQELKLFEQIVIILLEFAQPIINLDESSTLAEVRQAYSDYYDVVKELNSWRKKYTKKDLTTDEKTQWSLSSECQEFYTHFFHAVLNQIQKGQLFAYLALTTEDNIFDESTTLRDVVASNTDFSNTAKSVINLGKIIDDSHLMWISRAKQSKNSVDWRQLDELMINLQSFNLELVNGNLPITDIDLPKGVVECLINELITNSEQIAVERNLSSSPKPKLEFIYQNQDKPPKLILRYRDYSGGFEDLEIPVGQTKRKGGTGIGWRVITQISTALSSQISRENWGMEENGGQPIGAKITLTIPLQSMQKESTDTQPVAQEQTELEPVIAA